MILRKIPQNQYCGMDVSHFSSLGLKTESHFLILCLSPHTNTMSKVSLPTPGINYSVQGCVPFYKSLLERKFCLLDSLPLLGLTLSHGVPVEAQMVPSLRHDPDRFMAKWHMPPPNLSTHLFCCSVMAVPTTRHSPLSSGFPPMEIGLI